MINSFHRKKIKKKKPIKEKNMKLSCSERRVITISLCLIFCLSNSILVIASPAKDLCLPDQRDALWEFKNEFYIQRPDWRMSETATEKWRNNTDCCSWDGISCDPKTGVVVELNLEYSNLNGPLRSNSSLFRLQHLQTLKLGHNNLSGTLPDSIGNLKYLRVLSLRRCKFIGKIPSSLGNLSYLSELDLSFNDLTGEIPDWMGNLKYLKVLRLRYCNLFGKIPSAFGNLSNLAVLSLSDNDLTSERPDSMGNLNRLTDFQLMLLNMSSLTYINLGFNQFRGMLPSNMSSLSKLEAFDISGNSFSGTIPSSLFMIPSLTYLDLGTNNFSGPLEIGNISSQSKLRDLFIGENNFNPGIVDLSIFSRLLSLSYLDLSGINLKISSTLHFPSAMGTLILSSCNILEFPKFLQNQTSLYDLDISANQIEGQVPEWLWRLPTLRRASQVIDQL
ncbi:receptor-like protein 12 isoform X2 [Arabidopsis lyrata subsp. lyrata]|uniref:receptor-like protein 12 isoform X2 n=1 Tax=Arabidopsis lyrata subsp. lyrata TaxID=81972 RepID=UPI000A29E15F|nr:receptor-like protein 12 isoform X2 [Arabidopsis lyrata subsp. lyrata]|eukprot:XP_020874395.1 receptor-like protein 12 isoform X2 [Arabidopsis lyrata subsp. lyrata]